LGILIFLEGVYSTEGSIMIVFGLWCAGVSYIFYRL